MTSPLGSNRPLFLEASAALLREPVSPEAYDRLLTRRLNSASLAERFLAISGPRAGAADPYPSTARVVAERVRGSAVLRRVAVRGGRGWIARTISLN